MSEDYIDPDSESMNDPVEDNLSPLSVSRSSDFDPADILSSQDAPGAFSSDWASELMRMKLGTESFFTFLIQLDTIDENVAAEEAVVPAFLDLMNMEREKFGRKPLSSSYTAQSVLASKIVPHTIFSGTASLASLLAELSPNDEGKMAVEELLSFLDRHLNYRRITPVRCKNGCFGSIRATTW